MNWLRDLFLSSPTTPTVAHALIIFGIVAALGVGVGKIKIFGVSLGVAGVLFVGILFGHFHVAINHDILEFARDFGYILFIYTVGIQVGPGFVASLKKQGLTLNLLAASNVILGVIAILIVGRLILPHNEFPAVVGVFSGATTSTPSLEAAQQALKDIVARTDTVTPNMPALGYAVAYPFGIMGIILTMFAIKAIFKINIAKETEKLAQEIDNGPTKLDTLNVEVKNPNLDGLSIEKLMRLKADSGVVVSRMMRDKSPVVARDSSVISRGDVLLAVGPPEELEDFRRIVGEESPLDLKKMKSPINAKKMIVTQTSVIGKSVPELNFMSRFGVTVTRIHRGEVELPATRNVKIQYGDLLTVVGEENEIETVAKEVGDSIKRLDTPMVVPMFLGIVAGVILGSVPIPIPGLPAPLTLGIAGGPLVMAIILSRIGKIGNLVWYMPRGANLMVREIGIILFVASVGLKAGDKFVQTIIHGHGLIWMGYGALVTIIPLMIVALIARIAVKLNYLPLCGLLAGSMTDSPALAFAGSITGSEAPSVAYASVYPLVLLLRVLSTQAMVLMFH